MGDNLVGVGVNQGGKRGGDAQGGLALSAGIGSGTGTAKEEMLAVGVGVGVGGTADASANGGDASDNSYIGSITINA